MRSRYLSSFTAAAIIGTLVLSAAQALASPGKAVITVGEVAVSDAEFTAAYRDAVRSRFFHGSPSEEALREVRRQVAERIVERILLLREASRLGVEPAEEAVDAALERMQRRGAGHGIERAALREAVVEELRVELLAERVRTVAEPDAQSVRRYYESNPDKFTRPEQVRLSLILLAVDPASPPETWQAAREQAARLVSELRGGAEFEELAALHSADPSAERGGSLGYLHRGMLSEPVERAINGLEVGGISEPQMVLEGVAVFRLDQRLPEHLMPLAEVAARARLLLREELSAQRWEAFMDAARDASVVAVDEAFIGQITSTRVD